MFRRVLRDLEAKGLLRSGSTRPEGLVRFVTQPDTADSSPIFV